MFLLTNDCLYVILTRYCTVNDALRLRATCKEWNTLIVCGQNKYWYKQYQLLMVRQNNVNRIHANNYIILDATIHTITTAGYKKQYQYIYFFLYWCHKIRVAEYKQKYGRVPSTATPVTINRKGVPVLRIGSLMRQQDATTKIIESNHIFDGIKSASQYRKRVV